MWFPTVLLASDKLPGPTPPAVRGDVLTAVETELRRLKIQAEKEHGPEVPVPSEEVAYLLLSGIAGKGNSSFIHQTRSDHSSG